MSGAGVLLVDKPPGITSHDVVARMRRIAGTRRVGHAGTLDPLATGLLLVGIGGATRLLTHLVGLDKEYAATIRLGIATTTDDAGGEVVRRVDASGVRRDAIADAVAALTGRIEQVPSSVSAIKVDGRRAYDRVRAGEDVELRARPVTVEVFEVREERREGALVDLDVRAAVSSGTYIRALARDLGTALGVGGHLTALRRIRVGPFDVRDAVPPDEGALDALLSPAETAARLFPAIRMDEDATRALRQGKRIPLVGPDDPLADRPTVAALAPDGALVGLASTRGGVARVLMNLPEAQEEPS